MATIPYSVVLTYALTASGSLEASYQVPTNQEFIIEDMIVTNVGTFNLISLRNSEGLQYSSASETNPIPNTQLKEGVNDNNFINPFKYPLSVDKGRTIYVKLLDTSAAPNAVTVTLLGKRVLQIE